MIFQINPPLKRNRKRRVKRSKNWASEKKFGKGKSTYRLYVIFKLPFRKPHLGFNYYSRDEPDYRAGLNRLLRNVLNGTCKGRYQMAMLYEELTNQCLRVYYPYKPPVSFWDYEAARKKRFTKPLLKAQVKFQRPYIEKLISEGKRYSMVLKSMDNSSKAAALEDLNLQLSKEPFLSNLRWADVYDQADNRKVARICFGGGVERF